MSSSAPKIKFCGITRLDDAEQAVAPGAWAIGMISLAGLAAPLPARGGDRIAAACKRRVEVAGVFVNPTLDEVARTAEMVGLTLVQLHGDEGPSFCSEVARRTGAKVIKAARVRSGADIQALTAVSTPTTTCSTATPRACRGGTGETFAWELVTRSPRLGAGDPQRRADPGQRRRGDRRRRDRTPSTSPAASS